MQTGLTILTTADADEAVMCLFAAALSREEFAGEGTVTWLVVDGLRAYPLPPDLSGLAVFPGLRWITPPAPLSQLRAVMHGLSLTQGRVVIMDPDMPANVGDIPEFLAAHHKGAEIVFGRRILRRGIGPLRRLLTTLYNVAARHLLGVPIHDLNTPMISISPAVVDLIRAAPPDCPSPRFLVFDQLKGGLDEVPISVTELPKKSSYSPLSRASLGITRLVEIFRFIAWKKRSGR